MKKIGDAITMLGQVTVNTNGHEIRLWDGSFRTGFRVTKFIISIEAPTGAYEAVGKLHTSPTTGSISQWDWGDTQEIAWSAYGAPTKAGQLYSVTDPDNLIIQNLYFSNYGTADSDFINYYIEMQKYEMPEWRGALSLARNLAQGNPT